MTYNYSFQGFDAKSMARIAGKDMPISSKNSIEIASFIRGKKVDTAIKHLQRVTEAKMAVPYKRFKRDIGHKPGKVGPGRYPRIASEYIIKLLENLKSQATGKGMDVTKLTVIHSAAQRGRKLWHYGRMRRQRKNTNFEIVAKEVEAKTEAKKTPPATKKVEAKK